MKRSLKHLLCYLLILIFFEFQTTILSLMIPEIQRLTALMIRYSKLCLSSHFAHNCVSYLRLFIFPNKHYQLPDGFPRLFASGPFFKSAYLLLTSGSPMVLLSHFIRQRQCSHFAIVPYIYIFIWIFHRSLSVMSSRAFPLQGLINNNGFSRVISGNIYAILILFRSSR